MNYNLAKEKLESYLMARIPIIILKTLEKDRVVKMISQIHENFATNIYIHSMSKGMYDINTKEIVSNEKNLMSVLSFIADDLKNKRNVTYVLCDVNDISEDNVTSEFLCDVVTLAEERSCSIIIITEQSVWPNLRRLGMNIDLDLPNEEEILSLLHNCIDKYKNDIDISWDENKYKEASTILLGLSEAEIKNVLSVLIAKRSITDEDLVDLKFAKSNLFANMDGLEQVSIDDVVFGGLVNLKKWLNSKKQLFDVSKKEDLKKRGIKPPRGILVVGVPGCGKSLTAKAISKLWNLPLYLLDFATVQGKYVGQSEEQLKQALKTAEHVSPCILWIDEIEKGLSGVNDSSGVTSRMIGQFLYWLQESDKEVFVVATANEVTSLPAELLRKGRFDEIFFVDLPNEKERKEILQLYFAKYLQVRVDDEFINKLITLTDGFASSDIEATIRNISYDVIADQLSLSKELIEEYFNKASSISKTNPERIEAIKKWGKDRAISAS